MDNDVKGTVSSIFHVKDTPLLRKGVNKVALRLFEHNEKAYHAAVRMMEQYGKAAIVHPTGTGKSYIAFKLIEDNPEKVVIWLSPSEYIFKTQLESLKRNDPDFPLANVHFYTYAKLMCCTKGQLAEIAGLQPSYIGRIPPCRCGMLGREHGGFTEVMPGRETAGVDSNKHPLSG